MSRSVMHTRLRFLLAGEVVATSAAGVAGAIPDAGGVLHASFNANGARSNNGTELYVVDSESGATCKGSLQEITGSQQGPPGPQGTEGPIGPQGPRGDTGVPGPGSPPRGR